jgi:hypothetical protein
MIGSLRSACLGIAGSLPLLAAGCAGTSPPPPPAPVAAAPAGPVSVDGVYQGSRQLVRGGDGPGVLCGQIDPFSVTVAGRAFQYVLHQPEVAYQPTRTFNVTINADGTFRSVDGPAYLDGSAGGGTMQGEVSGDACGYVFQADRQH